MLIQSSVFARTTCVQEPCLKNMALVESTQPLNLVPLWLAFVTRTVLFKSYSFSAKVLAQP